MDNALHRHLRAAIELDPPTIQPHRRNQEDSGTNGQRGPGIQPAQPPENRLNPKSHAHPKPTGGSRLNGSLMAHRQHTRSRGRSTAALFVVRVAEFAERLEARVRGGAPLAD